jgi:hypothetical protein
MEPSIRAEITRNTRLLREAKDSDSKIKYLGSLINLNGQILNIYMDKIKQHKILLGRVKTTFQLPSQQRDKEEEYKNIIKLFEESIESLQDLTKQYEEDLEREKNTRLREQINRLGQRNELQNKSQNELKNKYLKYKMKYKLLQNNVKNV